MLANTRIALLLRRNLRLCTSGKRRMRRGPRAQGPPPPACAPTSSRVLAFLAPIAPWSTPARVRPRLVASGAGLKPRPSLDGCAATAGSLPQPSPLTTWCSHVARRPALPPSSRSRRGASLQNVSLLLRIAWVVRMLPKSTILNAMPLAVPKVNFVWLTLCPTLTAQISQIPTCFPPNSL
jgi:hypothetical protein